MSGITFDELKAIMSRCTGDTDSGQLRADDLTTPFTEIGYDSLAVLEIASQLQREYGMQIPDEAIEEMSSPQAVLDYVNASLSAA